MKTVAIVGVGLIGGSFGLAVRKAGFDGEILGVSSPSAVEAAIRAGAISRKASLEEAATSADLIYLAQTVDRILTTLETLGPIANSDCLITDAGSTKTAIVRKATKYVRSGFIGGHPIAGKEQRGVEAADANLFCGRPYILTPTAGGTHASEEFRLWLSRIGASVIEMSPPEHDALVGLTSHLPQLVAVALARALAQGTDERLKEVAGPGLLSMTRLALSSPAIWESIIATNKTEIVRALDVFGKSLDEVRAAVEAGAVNEAFGTGAVFARSIRNLAHKDSGPGS